MRFLSALPVVFFAASALAQTTPRAEVKFDTLADQFARDIQLARKSYLFPKILVIDFLNTEDKVTEGGASLADRFSSDEKMALSAKVIRISDAKDLSTANMDLSVPQGMKSALDKPLDWPTNSDVVVPCTSTRRDETDEFKERGVNKPKCIRCPNPPPSEEALKAKYRGGTVRLTVIVDEKGQVRSPTIIKGDDYGNDLQSINTIKTWKFEPAIRHGKPVAVCVPFEVTFSLY